MTRRRLTTIASAAALIGALALTGCVSGQDAGEAVPGGGASQPADNGQGAPSAPDDSGSTDPGDEGQGAPGDDSQGSSSDGIGMEEAGRIATDEYGGTVKGVEDDHYKGTPAWEVEIKDSDEGRIEVKVDKKTGEILDMEHD